RHLPRLRRPVPVVARAQVSSRLLLAAFALALAARLLGVALLPFGLAKDALEYHRLAAGLALGAGYVDAEGGATAFRPPGWPTLLASVYRIAGPEPVAGKIALAVVGAAVAPLAGWLGQALGGASV